MFTEETRPAPRPSRSSPHPRWPAISPGSSHVAARPSMQARYPQLAEMFDGREDLADASATFWGDAPEEDLLHRDADAGPPRRRLCATDPDVLWAAIERAVATVPLDLDDAVGDPRGPRIFLDRFRRLRESPELLRSYLDLLKEVWAPVNDMWQQALPLIEEAGRHLVAQFERGQSLETLDTPGL